MERWAHAALEAGRSAGERLSPPAGDGAAWWANPQVVNVILLAIITLLVALSFGAQAQSAPRRIAYGLRRFRDRQRHRRSLRAPKQLFLGRRPILRGAARRLQSHGALHAEARSMMEARLDAMVGLVSIKRHLIALLDCLEMDERRRASMPSFTTQRGCMHMVFLGNPGTGKTAVAQLVACVLRELGVLRHGHLVVAKKADLLGRYSNHVSRNTRAMVESALGGVLFIDEGAPRDGQTRVTSRRDRSHD